MRRLFYMILALAVLSACSKEDVVDVTTGGVISFGNVFIDNSTKAPEAGDPTHTAANLDKFNVYGTITGMNGTGATASIYSGEEVTRLSSGTNIWTASVERYWVPTSHYSFAAITGVGTSGITVTLSDGTNTPSIKKGLPVSINYDVTTQEDLLYATADAETDQIGAPSGSGITEITSGTGAAQETLKALAFSFEHLLSLVQFEFTNGFPDEVKDEDDVVLTVTNIKITNAAKTATYTIGTNGNNGSWNTLNLGNGNTATLEFGQTEGFHPNEAGYSSKKCVLIPGTQAFNISFTIEHNKGGEPTSKEFTTQEITLQKGYCYNFTTELNASNVEGVVPIIFSITKNEEWSGDDHQVDHRKF